MSQDLNKLISDRNSSIESASSSDILPNVKWTIKINSLDQLSQISYIIDLLRNEPGNQDLPTLLEDYLANLVEDINQREFVIQALLNNDDYRQTTIQEISEWMSEYTLTLYKLPVEILWQILLYLDVYTLRVIYDNNPLLRSLMDQDGFVNQLFERYKIRVASYEKERDVKEKSKQKERHLVDLRQKMSHVRDPNKRGSYFSSFEPMVPTLPISKEQEIINVGQQIKDLKDSKYSLFNFFFDKYVSSYYIPEFCYNNDKYIDKCIINAARQGLVSDVLELYSKFLRNPLDSAYQRIYSVLINNYKPEYKEILVNLSKEVNKNVGIGIYHLISSETFDNIPYADILDISIHSFSSSTNNVIVSSIVLMISDSLLFTERIDDWLDLYKKIKNFSLDNRIYYVKKILTLAGFYDLPAVVETIMQMNYDDETILETIAQTLGVISKVSLLVSRLPFASTYSISNRLKSAVLSGFIGMSHKNILLLKEAFLPVNNRPAIERLLSMNIQDLSRKISSMDEEQITRLLYLDTVEETKNLDTVGETKNLDSVGETKNLNTVGETKKLKDELLSNDGRFLKEYIISKTERGIEHKFNLIRGRTLVLKIASMDANVLRHLVNFLPNSEKTMTDNELMRCLFGSASLITLATVDNFSLISSILNISNPNRALQYIVRNKKNQDRSLSIVHKRDLFLRSTNRLRVGRANLSTCLAEINRRQCIDNYLYVDLLSAQTTSTDKILYLLLESLLSPEAVNIVLSELIGILSPSQALAFNAILLDLFYRLFSEYPINVLKELYSYLRFDASGKRIDIDIIIDKLLDGYSITPEKLDERLNWLSTFPGFKWSGILPSMFLTKFDSILFKYMDNYSYSYLLVNDTPFIEVESSSKIDSDIMKYKKLSVEELENQVKTEIFNNKAVKSDFTKTRAIRLYDRKENEYKTAMELLQRQENSLREQISRGGVRNPFNNLSTISSNTRILVLEADLLKIRKSIYDLELKWDKTKQRHEKRIELINDGREKIKNKIDQLFIKKSEKFYNPEYYKEYLLRKIYQSKTKQRKENQQRLLKHIFIRYIAAIDQFQNGSFKDLVDRISDTEWLVKQYNDKIINNTSKTKLRELLRAILKNRSVPDKVLEPAKVLESDKVLEPDKVLESENDKSSWASSSRSSMAPNDGSMTANDGSMAASSRSSMAPNDSSMAASSSGSMIDINNISRSNNQSYTPISPSGKRNSRPPFTPSQQPFTPPNYNLQQYNPTQPQYNPSQPQYNPSKPQYNPSQPQYTPISPSGKRNTRPPFTPPQQQFAPQYNPSQSQYNPSQSQYNPSRNSTQDLTQNHF